MYSRSFYPDTNERLTIPDNYDGTALIEAPPVIEEKTAEASVSIPDIDKSEESTTVSLGKIPFLSGIFGNSKLNLGIRLPKIGTEEILIIATAAFLFFSKDGDRECAIMLALLLLIN